MRRIGVLGLLFPVGYILAGSVFMDRRLGRFRGKSLKGQKPAEPDANRMPYEETFKPGNPAGNLN